ncbi:MAG TPA: 1-acyl-sn-glycerol-3-phosphate acyltransferase [Oscillospiraceae bacterium]|nr:1-acyl-sn-glycerol-3-phosphate acyltransferase [Oscillospiraceae bacterium]HPV99599.1 1-acyl-sn-glycerol-3-phosphate acyltransferase [Oscillospiraceae bacterium]
MREAFKKKNRWAHLLIWTLFKLPLRLLLKWKLGYRYEKVDNPPEPCFVVCNHTCNWDPLLAALPFRRQMYFVAGEQLSRMGFASRLIGLLADPIYRLKARTEARSAAEILQCVRAGYSVCMFPEGSCTWDGRTAPAYAGTGRLVRKCGVPLYIYRIEGGYFTLPRWSKSIRKGNLEGALAAWYPARELAGMTDEEIDRRIAEHLAADAYAYESAHPGARKCGRRAESLEAALYLCPACGKMGAFRSKGDQLVCSACGLTLILDEQMKFKTAGGGEPPFPDIGEWVRWQKARTAKIGPELAELPPETCLTSDSGVTLRTYLPGAPQKSLGSGTLSLYPDRLAFAAEGGETFSFPLSELSDISTMLQCRLEFCCAGIYYETLPEAPYSALKYAQLAGAMNEKTRVMI